MSKGDKIFTPFCITERTFFKPNEFTLFLRNNVLVIGNYVWFFCFCFQQLYQLGARKVIVTAVGQIGCIPYQLARYNHSNNSNARCNENINKAIVLFNSGLRKMVDQFNAGELPGAKFVYIDSYQSTYDLYQNGTLNGIIKLPCYISYLSSLH